MTPRHLILAAALVAGAVPSPAAAQSRTESVILGELRQNQEQLTRATAEIGKVVEQMRAIDRRITDLENANTKGLADQRIQISGLASTMQTMREKLEDSALRTTQTTQEIAAVREGVRMLTEQINILIGLLQPPTAGAEPGAGGTTFSPGMKPIQMPPSPASLMGPAMGDYLAQRYQLGIDGFEEVIKTFPGTLEASKAQFYIGESYRVSNRSKEALAAYDKVIAGYKDSEYARDAMLSKGVTYLDNMKQPNQARAEWDRLIKLYPNSSQANQAEQQIKRIR